MRVTWLSTQPLPSSLTTPHRIEAGSGPDVVSPLNFKTLIREYSGISPICGDIAQYRAILCDIAQYRQYRTRYKPSAVVTEATVRS